MIFPDTIPVAIPVSASNWPPVTVGDFINDNRYLNFIDAWQRELRHSPREALYLGVITSTAGFTDADAMSLDLLRRLLRTTLDLVTGKPPEIEHPVAAFELLSVMDGLSETALQSLPKSARRKLDMELTVVSGSVHVFAFQALKRHFEGTTQAT